MESIPVSRLLAQLDTYVVSPTAWRDMMSSSASKMLKRSVKLFLEFHNYNTTMPHGSELVDRIREWLNAAEHARSTKSLMLSLFLAFLREHEYITPESSVPLRRRFNVRASGNWSTKALSNEEIAIFLDYHHRFGVTTFVNLRRYVLSATLLLTGSRLNAMLDCQNWFTDVDVLSICIPKYKTKIPEDVWKDIPLNIILPDGRDYGKHLMQYIARREYECATNPFLFCNEDGSRMKDKGYQSWLGSMAVPFEVGAHRLRHTAATVVAQRAGVMQANALLDHSTIAMTQRYIQKHKDSTLPIILKAWSGIDVEIATDATVEDASEKTKRIFRHTISPSARRALKAYRKEVNKL